MPVILAHLGHWYVSLAYVAPVLVVVALLVWLSWRDKRRARAVDPSEGEATTII